ncbi:hypothetical protein [Actinoplanes teichomyceticus]|uniref:hypothetical protein n=1 Tax=Actinoplanes teichomyceticus TaxID=1867 RepID=UPI0011A9ED4C|nr:hypothetical protein [Actinoplanes teichomyceticus]GIF17186.1 hypothetical protein Ate01nite_72180 [Actinoplanes teichomyceticus]
MSAPPPADWGTLTPRLHAGDRVCITHGLVTAERAPIGIPICPHCRQMLSTVRTDRQGRITGFAEPIPPRCAGPQQHPLGARTVLLGWRACLCENTRLGPQGHRLWSCRRCRELGRPQESTVQSWPPCAGPDGAAAT